MTESFRKALNSGKFVVSSEIGPPKGTNIDTMCHHIDILKNVVDGINCTDHQSSVMRFPSIGGCLYIKEMGGEPILQMTCRDRNQMALQAELLLAYVRGIRNVLCLTGDSIVVGDHKHAADVFELDSSQLLKTIRQLEKGTDLGGKMVVLKSHSSQLIAMINFAQIGRPQFGSFVGKYPLTDLAIIGPFGCLSRRIPWENGNDSC